MKALIWNIRSVNTQKAFTRLVTLQKRYHFTFIGLMEPFQENSTIDEYRRRLNIKDAVANCAGKIWAFTEDFIHMVVLRDEEQQLTIQLTNQETDILVVVTLVYAKCNQQERLCLWESLIDMAQTIQHPWLIGGDFNVIVSEEEKLGGLPVTVAETEDFKHCINLCGMEDPGFKGSKYTWWNGRTDAECIFERLDRLLCNDRLQELFQVLEVEHLFRSGSDHSPLQIHFSPVKENIHKPFRFLNMWLKEQSCYEVIKQNWITDVVGNPFIEFHHKMKRVKNALTK